MLGPGQRLYFTWAESNGNKKNPLFSLISIRFGSCEVRRLTRTLAIVANKMINEITLFLTLRNPPKNRCLKCNVNQTWADFDKLFAIKQLDYQLEISIAW